MFENTCVIFVLTTLRLLFLWNKKRDLRANRFVMFIEKLVRFETWSVTSFLCLTLMATSGLSAERVSGAGLVEEAGDVASILYDLAAERLEKKEIEGFLESADGVLDWANDNVDQWLRADAAEEPLGVIRSFAVWESVDLSAAEFVATLVKLMFLREFEQEPGQLKGLKKEIEQMDAVVTENRLSPFVLEQARKEIAEKRRLVELLQGNTPRNVKLYKVMQERIDPVLDRFERIGQ